MSVQQAALLCQYRYDPLDRLINQTQTHAPTHQRFYCKSRLATEIQGSMGRSIVQHGGQLLAEQQREGDVIDTTLLATDLQRSVLHTLDKSPSKESFAYMPYGHLPKESGLTILLGFAGERHDTVTGHYLLGNGYRAFNPVLMRFNSPDSWSPFGKGGLNAYGYCLGDPVSFTDPTGHMVPVLNLITKMSDITLLENITSLSALESVHFDIFNNIAKYLDRTDMDKLSRISKPLADLSEKSSLSNLKTYLVAQRKLGRPLRLDLSSTTPLVDDSLFDAGLRSVDEYPILRGVTSVALTKIDPAVKGPKTLVEYSRRVRDGVSKEIGSGSYSNYGDWEQAVNARHVDHLLRSIEN